jgi:chromate reductase
MPTIVCISGTSRPDNFTSRALAVVEDELKSHQEVTVIGFDAREISLNFPGFPPTEDAERLRSAVEGSAGIVLATPEYHGGFSAMTKLLLENLGFPSLLKGKPMALVGVAAGRIGAIKSLEQLRGVCAHTGALVLPGSVSIAGVRSAFDEEGNCLDAGVEESLRGIAGALMGFIQDYVCPKHTLEAMVRGENRAWTASV